jgi:SAM-dependent methyltransferase
MNDKLSSVEAQRRRYDKEARPYEKHHGHELNQKYRDAFIRKKIFDFDLQGKTVLDGMCASGIETGYLLSHGAQVTGLDISGNNIALYQEKWGCAAHVASIHHTGLPSASFDVVYIFGGLHHVIPLLDETMYEVHRLLKPGGSFVFVEPNKDTFANKFRELWYKADRRFQTEERAISYPELAGKYLGQLFTEDKVIYGGNLAYLPIGQSLILGIPVFIKRALFRLLFFLERTVGSTRVAPKLFFAARWTKL